MIAAAIRLRKEFQAFRREKEAGNIDRIQVANDPTDVYKWHFLLYGFEPDSDYHHGVYHGVLTYPPTYPFAPPNIKFLTPNGRPSQFQRQNFHPESWNPSWTMRTILLGIYSFFLGSIDRAIVLQAFIDWSFSRLDPADPATAGSIVTGPAQRRKLAQQSMSTNRKSPLFRTVFGYEDDIRSINQDEDEDSDADDDGTETVDDEDQSFDDTEEDLDHDYHQEDAGGVDLDLIQTHTTLWTALINLWRQFIWILARFLS